MSETQEAVRQAGTFGSLPVLKEERVWGFGDFTWVNISLAIATWAFLVGGATALMVGFSQGVLAMLIGNVSGVIIMLLATTVISIVTAWSNTPSCAVFLVLVESP
jgi:nucleobase:cation symporter-1, NCS1 family